MDVRSRSGGNPWRRLALAMLGTLLLLPACAAVQSRGDAQLAQALATRPTWRVGDRWVYAWTAGTAKGVKTSECLGVHEAGGVKYNVLRVETAHLYFTPDLHWAASVVDSRVVARATPPLPWFSWPLEPGKRWQHQGVYEEKERKDRMRESYRVVGSERVEVPAGTFRAVKIVREVDAAVADQYWYSPDVRWYVKWVGRRGQEEFQELLQEFAPAAGAK